MSHKHLLPLAAILCPLLLACLCASCRDSKSMVHSDSCRSLERAKIEEHLSLILKKYPKMTLADIYKGAFQDYMGPAHIIPDSKTALFYIEKELQEADTLPGDYYTPCGWYGNYRRVNLRIIKEGLIGASDFAHAFARGATGVDSTRIAQWRDEWTKAMETISGRASEIEGFSADSAAIMEMLEKGEYVVHHSTLFNAAYRPHYRIIREDIFEKEILTLLK